MADEMIRIDLTVEQLEAVTNLIGERVSATNERGTPLAEAEYELDSALLAHENEGATPERRLENLRTALRAQRISYGQLAELQDLIPHIEPGDVELLEAAGVPEFAEEESSE